MVKESDVALILIAHVHNHLPGQRWAKEQQAVEHRQLIKPPAEEGLQQRIDEGSAVIHKGKIFKYSNFQEQGELAGPTVLGWSIASFQAAASK